MAPVWGHGSGFGGNGNATDTSGFRGFCVTDGPFARFEIPFIGTMVMPHCLSRDFLSGERLTEYSQRLRPSALEEVLQVSNYEKFNDVLETGPHLSLPHIIRGDFSVPTAPQGMRLELSSGHTADQDLCRPRLLSPPYAAGQALVEVAAKRSREKVDRLFWQNSV